MLQACAVSNFPWATLPQPSLRRGDVAMGSIIRRKLRVSSSLAPQVSDLAVPDRLQRYHAPKSFPDKERLGKLAEDGLSYKESFSVRSFEVGANKTATIETIANLLQEALCNHAQTVGFSTDGFATTPTMRKRNLIWVIARMHIEVYKYTAWADVVEIETWCQEEGRISIRRDWILRDFATHEVIGRATSLLRSKRLVGDAGEVTPNVVIPHSGMLLAGGIIKWVVMDQVTRRLERVTDGVRDELSAYCPKTVRLAFPEKDSNCLKKISKIDDSPQHLRTGLVPRRADFDMNQHVNNVTYIAWVLESMPQEVLDTHDLQMITLDYRRECQRDDKVDSLTSLEYGEPEADSSCLAADAFGNGTVAGANEQPDNLQFLHLLRLSGTGLEISRGRTEWRRKPAS